MEIKKDIAGDKTTLALSGRLDTTTAPQLEAEFAQVLPAASQVVLDFSELAYISSAGLRVLLAAQKQINAKQGSMVLTNVDESIMEVFEITGFADILTFA